MQEMENANIRYFIEPGMSLQSCAEVLELAAQHPNQIFPAMGIHPMERSPIRDIETKHVLRTALTNQVNS